MLWFLLFIVLIGAGFYFYQELLTIQREIREEQQAALESEAEVVADKAVPAAEEEAGEADENAAEPAVVEEEPTLEGALLKAVSAAPGLLQSEIYPEFPDYTRKQLQQALRKLEDAGALRREKQGSSYLLFPAE
ncbi:MAG: hypothetical protein C0621_09965 [Desulfuromonas sp.]|nr:MAG: hypothetical protein C0621_09965 [Desulfuromonas sp.]